MIRSITIGAFAAIATLSLGAIAHAEDFPAAPMNAGPPTMMPMAQPMAPMAEPAMDKPMMDKPMTKRQKKMMMKKKMMMENAAQ